MPADEPPFLHSRPWRRRYRARLLACLAASLLLAIATVQLWPRPSGPEPAPRVYQSAAPIDRREVMQTQHAGRTAPLPPPPPAPLYETDRKIEQEPLDLTVELAPGPATRDAPAGPDRPVEGDDETSASTAPDVDARQLRIPEPHYTEAARAHSIRARVEMEVVITAGGRVRDARIVRRTLLSGTDEGPGPERPIQTLGYGLEEAALDAARRTLFRPARTGGEAVESRKRLTLTFGPGG